MFKLSGYPFWDMGALKHFTPAYTDVNHIRILPKSQVVWQRPPPSPAALVIRCAGDALVHGCVLHPRPTDMKHIRDALKRGCVLHPHPTDMKHIRILPESQVVWQRPPPSPAALVIRCAGMLLYTDVFYIHILRMNIVCSDAPHRRVIRCAGDALIHGCVLHPHPTDMKHIRILPKSQVIWQRPPPSPAALVIRCAGDALIHGCVLHPHPTDMKHIRILPESQVIWQRPPPSPAALVIRCAGDALVHGCVLHPRPTDMKHIRILPES
ncbi:hypothetical protein BT96DRAFT_1007840 [Gymnopus androsaceus JB14]|uniref:Uncharacterized protein n=1 Tax=Gymnopus androsaceus JB14 TaxID=1447944 RepID=A0A6A4GHB0_9AGAR|nr:hypothetical protein BT96DRAFT_1007840 [Gymnopus androsaceus JB14]